jgi:hypothetical protein
MTLPGVLIVFAMVLFMAVLLVGLVYYSRDRAESVREAERLPTAEQIVQLGLLPRRPAPTNRQDRHDAYIWLHVGLLLVGLGIVLAPAPASALTTLSWDAQKLLGLCMLTGSGIALTGVLMGVGHRSKIRDNVVSQQLGDDVRLPYTFAALGLFSVGVSMGGYGWAIYQYSTLVGTLGGGLTFAILGMCVSLCIKFVLRARRYSRDRDGLLTEATRRLQAKP